MTCKQAVAAVRRRFTDSPGTVWAAIFGIYLVARVLMIIGGDVFQAPDSAAYAARNDPSRDHGPLLSFIGHAPRPWGLPLFYAIFGTDEWRAVGQWVLATAAWAAASDGQGRRSRSRWTRSRVARTPRVRRPVHRVAAGRVGTSCRADRRGSWSCD